MLLSSTLNRLRRFGQVPFLAAATAIASLGSNTIGHAQQCNAWSVSTFHVDALTPSWQNSGVAVSVGDMLIIEASGTACPIAGCLGCTGPDGEVNVTNNATILTPVAFNALLGYAGGPPTGACGDAPNGWLLDDGRDVSGTGISYCQTMPGPGVFGPGFVGSRFAAISGGSGHLYFIVNDDACGYFADNCGGYDLTITVVPAANVSVTTVNVFGTVAQWQPTSVNVAFNAPILIQASGQACCCGGAGYEDPDGSDIVAVGCPTHPNILPNRAFMSLVGAIDIPPTQSCATPLCGQVSNAGVLLDDGWDVDGPGKAGACQSLGVGVPGAGMYGPGFVGTNFFCRAPKAGEIRLAVNDDAWDCFNDNCGQFTATIYTPIATNPWSVSTFHVDALTPSWQNSGVAVSVGDMLIIEASGTACPIAGCLGCTGPDGEVNVTNNATILTPVAFNALLGYAGGPPTGACGDAPNGWLLDDGRDVSGTGISYCQTMPGPGVFGPGFVGSRFAAISGGSGHLYFIVNDDACGYFAGNCGGYDLTITVVPAANVSVTTVNVFGTVAQWQPTSVNVAFNAPILIQASGQACCCGGAGYEDPDGSDIVAVGCPTHPNILPNRAFMSLVGAIDIPPTQSCATPLCGQASNAGVLLDDGWDVDGPGKAGACQSLGVGVPGTGMYGPGFVGTNFFCRAPKAGEIRLAVNDDAWDCFNDNCGLFTVTVYTPIYVGPTAYCVGKLNSVGCVPTVTWTGCPSLSLGLPFVIGAKDVINQKVGILFYGYAPAAFPFQGGTMCVAAPIRRTPMQNSGGSSIALNDCSGRFAFDFNDWAQSGSDPNLVAGIEVHAQHWYRDPFIASTTGLTNALHFVLGP